MAAGLFNHFHLLWRWDNLIYDAQLSLWSRSVADDIVIIAIDDQSLADLGHWPWPREIHARLIETLTEESAQAIGLDIIFSEPDRYDPASDQALAAAIQRSGKVVLPVYMSRQSRNSVPVEALPMPALASAAARLGHVHVAVGRDGIARRIFLREGIGEPHWWHFSLALLSLADAQMQLPEVEAAAESERPPSMMQWSRAHPVLIPFAGPPGHFTTIGYSQVLAGTYPRDLFRDKIVLIGATAEGLGDALPTPMTGDEGVMSGVEIIANMIDAQRRGLDIRSLPDAGVTILTLIMVALPILVYPYLNPARTLVFLAVLMLTTVSLVALIMWSFGLWIPASTMLLFQLLSYPLWSWRRLVLVMRHVNHELESLFTRQQNLSLQQERNLASELEFLKAFVPVQGWVVFDADGRRLLQWGEIPPRPREAAAVGQWQQYDDELWTGLLYQHSQCQLGLKIANPQAMTQQQRDLLDVLLQPANLGRARAPYLEDVLLTRIEQVQNLSNEYQALHRNIDNSLAGMSDGILICNAAGQVLFSNRRAGWYLRGDDDARFNGLPLNTILDPVHPVPPSDWATFFSRVLFQGKRAITEAQHDSGRDLMVQISPLPSVGATLPGMIVNLSDTTRLKASERRRSEMINFLSHDLRAPLASMLAMIELAQTKQDLQSTHAALDSMQQNTHRILHLAEQFVQLSRATGSQSIQLQEVDLVSIVYNATDQMWAFANQHQVKIEQQFEQDELWTLAEPDLLERALVNLLSNAIKHSQSGQTVSIGLHLSDQVITCCVADRGQGIAADEIPELFKPYHRTRGAAQGRMQGSGLGLAFVEAVARRHQGQVSVKSRPGQGAQFCLKMPLQPCTPA